MKKLAFAALASGHLMGTAHPADQIVSDPVVDVAAAAHDWNGFYAGVLGGYGAGTTTFVSGGATQNLGTSGWLLGVTAGYNHQWDMFVLGVEGDIAWSNIGGSAPLVTTPALTLSSNASWIGTLRGRAGVAVDQALLYVTAGFAAAGVNSTLTAPGGSFSATHTGWTAGAGIEYAVTDDWSVKAEYAYTALNTVTAPAATLAPAAVNISPSFHAVKIGANFHF